MFNFLKKSQTVFQNGYTILPSNQQCGRASFLTSHQHFPLTFIIHLFYYSHPRESDVVFHCGFDFHFPNDQYWWASPSGAYWPFVYLEEISTQILCPFSNWVICLSIVELQEIFICSRYVIFQIYNFQKKFCHS